MNRLLGLPKEQRRKGAFARAVLISAALVSAPLAASRFARGPADDVQPPESDRAVLCQNEPFQFKDDSITLTDYSANFADIEIRSAIPDGMFPKTTSIAVPGVVHFTDGSREYEMDVGAVDASSGKACAVLDIFSVQEVESPSEQKLPLFPLLAAAGAVLAAFVSAARFGRGRKI